MAELAIPLIALGSMYIISNHDKIKQEKNKESFIGMKESSKKLPNTEEIPDNYPLLNPVSNDNIRVFPNANQFTDKYFDPATYISVNNTNNIDETLENEPQFVSLSGNAFNVNEFKHNNMTPYFGAKIKGATVDARIGENILDNMQGSGSQLFSKTEVAPLFKPQENMQWSHGMPNQTDFYLSRVNPSMKMSNIKPWEEKMVAPGLDQGYTTKGSLGFNSGMEARDKWLPYTVDQLRVATKPKVTYELDGHQGPASSYIKNSGVIGKIEKHQPDTYYNNTPDRWFTTTGLEKAQTSRGIEVLHDVARPFTTQEYFGVNGTSDGQAGYAPQNYQKSHRQEKSCNIMGAPALAGKGKASQNDYARDSFKLLPTNRSESNTNSIGIVGGMAKAVIAPILDILKPSRKENFIENIRQYENAKGLVPSGSVYDPGNVTKTTNREMQESKLDNTHLNVQNQREGAYYITEQQTIDNNRNTTSISYTGNSSGLSNSAAPRTYNAEYNQRNNPNKTYENRPNQGGMQIFNQTENIKIDRRDDDRLNNRFWVRGTGPTVPNALPATNTYGKINTRQTYNENIITDRIQPDILSAFKENPYTKSLNSWA